MPCPGWEGGVLINRLWLPLPWACTIMSCRPEDASLEGLMLAACDTVGRGHRRTRSIEGLGASMDASETFRAELERIGSSGLSGAAKPSGQPAERPALAPSPPKAHLVAPKPVSRRSSVGSPLQQSTRMSSDAIPHLNLAPAASAQQVTLHRLQALCSSAMYHQCLLVSSKAVLVPVIVPKAPSFIPADVGPPANEDKRGFG